MNLAVVNEAVTEMNGVEHQFTEEAPEQRMWKKAQERLL